MSFLYNKNCPFDHSWFTMYKDDSLSVPPLCHDIDVCWMPMVPGALSITLNRPAKKNALRSQSYLELSRALEFASSCPDAACVVVSGSGDYFTAGADLQDDVVGQFEAPCDVMSLPVSRFFVSLIECSVPVIACVQGPAVGVGVTMLMLCDAVYSSSAATFWTPFARSGLAPEFASALLFPAAIGNTAASEMILCSKKMSADDAAACRLVGAVFPAKRYVS
jgi:enoyl-CoA hydratase/carnithine racemase